jgi:uncharacterized membrane protein
VHLSAKPLLDSIGQELIIANSAGVPFMSETIEKLDKERDEQLRIATNHTCVAVMGIGFSLQYMISSSIYHFFRPGFAVSIFGLLASSIYYYVSHKTLKKHRDIQQEQYEIIQARAEGNRRKSSRKISKTATLMKQQQLQETERGSNFAY